MNNNRINKQAGSVILEALIAILIFSIGILALVGLQATAINTVSDAKYRSTAAFLVDQIVGTVWATRQSNLVAVASGVVMASADQTFKCNPCTTATSNGNSYTQAWASEVTAALPSAVASVTIDPTGAIVTAKVSWQAPKDTSMHSHAVTTYVN